MTANPYASALVLGMGISGFAAARLLLAEGSAVTVVDQRPEGALGERTRLLREADARVLPSCEDLPMPGTGEYDVCFTSPGVALDSAWQRALRARGVPVLSELELGWSRLDCPVLAVTGTNGKSTLVRLCADALASAGLRTVAAGNIGRAVCDVVLSGDALDWVVLEVSSFQLETVRDFRPRVAVILNIQPDHLDRHGDMETYRVFKMRLLACMDEGDTAIVPVDAPDIQSACLPGCQCVTFGAADADYTADSDRVKRPMTPPGPLALSGSHFANPVMALTAAAAAAAIDACGAPVEALSRALEAFEMLPHRMAWVRTVQGVRFVDDSKATNLAALEAGLAMTPGPIRLIAGGLMKGDDPDSVKEVLASRVRTVYLIGDAADTLNAAWHEAVPCRVCRSLEEATGMAFEASSAGETIQLSPGCASFDQFQSYAQRGEAFCKFVRSIDEEK